MILKKYKKNLITSIVLRLFSVINGLVQLILFQQVTNLVNKFAVLLHKRWFTQDCRNTSGNDGCWRRWLSVCCNSFNTPHSALSRHSLPQGAREDGRSMIEMLGVLAIIAVLSVGGIAGYSKAMEMYKMNKTVEEYNYVIAGLLEHLPELQKLNSGGSQYMLTDFLLSANMVPATWKKSNGDFADLFGGMIAIFIRSNHLSLEIYHRYPYANGASLSSVEFCKTIIKNIALPLHSTMHSIGLYRFNYPSPIYGDAFCSEGQICIRDLTITEINKICNSYQEGVSYSSVILYF